MEPQLVTKILATDTNGETCIGTGYPIGVGMVLTARHVVTDDLEKIVPIIDLHWPDLTDELGNSVKSVKAEILFDGALEPTDDQLEVDVVVLACSFPQAVSERLARNTVLAEHPAKARGGWKCAGFPNINDNEIDPASGKFVADLEKQEIKLTLDDSINESIARANGVQNGWGGMSGAAVFNIETGKIQAVITDHNQWMQKQLIAVSIPWLIHNNPKFRALVGLETNTEIYCQFAKQQQKQIRALLEKMADGKLFKQLAKKCNVTSNCTHEILSNKLLGDFQRDDLAVLDCLLQVGNEVLEQGASEPEWDHFRDLFCLFVSLMAPQSSAVRHQLINLPVYTAIASELSLAPLYDTNPEFALDPNGEPKGKYAIDASVLTRETGWGQEDIKSEVVAAVYSAIHQKPPEKVLNAFELRRLNATIKQRQNRSFNKLHRLELNCADQVSADNPLHNSENCQAINEADCLPDLPIVHYGETEAEKEAELCAKLDELFAILNKYGSTS